MGKRIVEKIIADHFACGDMTKGSEVGIKIDQTLTKTRHNLFPCGQWDLPSGVSGTFCQTGQNASRQRFHTPTCGGMGMLGIGAGGLDVAMVMAGGTYYMTMPPKSIRPSHPLCR